MPVKLVEDMTDEECRQYVEAGATDKWWKEFVQLELQEGSTYRQIAFALQNN